MQSTRPQLTESLKTDSAARRSATSRWVSARDTLTTFEIALAVVLLAASGVLTRSLANLVGVHPGFEPRGVLTARVNRATAWSRDSISRFYDVAIDRLRSIPGVLHVAMADCSPQSGGCAGQEVGVLDHESGRRAVPAGLHWVTAEWHDVLRVPLLRGRPIAEADRQGARRVALVSVSASHEMWPNEDALGKRLIVQGRDTVTVVGVVGDVRYYGMRDEPRPDVYISYHQFPMSFRMMFLLRTSGNPAALAESVRRAVREVAPGFPVYDAATLETRIGGVLGEARFLAQLLSAFAVFALALATIGVYGVISYAVARRTREIGIRVALGATQRDVVRMVVRQGLVLATAGGALGLAGAFAAVRLIRAQLYGVEPTDPVTVVGILVVLTLVVFVASWMPARRAATVPAVDALRAV
jgi:putative ABC transport system permease protein